MGVYATILLAIFGLGSLKGANLQGSSSEVKVYCSNFYDDSSRSGKLHGFGSNTALLCECHDDITGETCHFLSTRDDRGSPVCSDADAIQKDESSNDESRSCHLRADFEMSEGSIEVIPDPSQTYNGTENETMEVLCRIERAMPIPTIHLYEVLENGPSEIHKVHYNASHTPGSAGATFDISTKFNHPLKYDGASDGGFRLRLEVFQATGNLRKVFIDGTVSRSVDSEIGNGERVVLFWILIPGLIIILTAVVALIGICYRRRVACFKSAKFPNNARSGVLNGAAAPHGSGREPSLARMSSTKSSAPPPYEEVTRKDPMFPSMGSMSRSAVGNRRKSGGKIREWESDNISFELNEYDDEVCDAEKLSHQKNPTTATASAVSTSDAIEAAAAIEEKERKIRELEAEFDRDAAANELPVVELCRAVYSVEPEGAGGALGGDAKRVPGVMRAAAGEGLSVLQRDLGSGWTFVRNGQGATGFVPTNALSINQQQ